MKLYKQIFLWSILLFICCTEIHIYYSQQSNENDSVASRGISAQHESAVSDDLVEGLATINLDPMSAYIVAKYRSRFPHIFIIGFGKTGTRVLYNSLLMHGNVVGPYSEMNFFDKYYQFGISWYLHHMPQPNLSVQVVAEKSPSYILDPEVPSRLIKFAKLFNVPIKKLKFVVMFRHPIVRAMSEYLEWQSLRVHKRQKVLPSFDQLAVDSQGMANAKGFKPLNHSLYAYYVKQWLQVFSSDQFCYVHGEMFAEHPYQTMSKLEKCLGLPPHISQNNFVWKEKRRFFCLSHEGEMQCPPLSKGRPHPFIQQGVVETLMRFFKPFNEELYALTGENYGWNNNYKGLNVQ